MDYTASGVSPANTERYIGPALRFYIGQWFCFDLVKLDADMMLKHVRILEKQERQILVLSR